MVFLSGTYPLQIAELKTYDWLIMNTEQEWNQQILIVDLDENFINNTEVGIPRSVYGDLIATTNAIPGITVLMPNKDIRGRTMIHTSPFACLTTNSPATAASTQVTSTGTHVGTAQLRRPIPVCVNTRNLQPTFKPSRIRRRKRSTSQAPN